MACIKVTIEGSEREFSLELGLAGKNGIDALLSRLADADRPTRTEAVRRMFVDVLPNQERNDKPTVPSEDAIRLQTRIDAEEFVEKLTALYEDCETIEAIQILLDHLAKNKAIRKDLHDRLPEFADALADNAVTNEGFAVLFGIDLEPVFREVHAANMRKKDGPIDEHGKLQKPVDWTPPDVAGVLRNQGWQPAFDVKVEASLGCELHGMIFGGGNECIRCENAQYNGSEVDPIGEQAGEDPIVLMLGATTISEKYGDPTYSMIFATNDTTVVERCKLYMQNRTKVIPEPVGMRVYPISLVKGVHVRPAAPSDGALGRRYSIEIEFRKVG